MPPAYSASPQYGAPPPPYQGGPGYGQMPLRNDYASWGRRVTATLLDIAITIAFVLVAVTLFIVGHGIGTILGILVYLALLGFQIWNIVIRQGATGQSIGKSQVKIKIVGESTGMPIGAGMTFVRQLVHLLDGVCYVGYAWPLWDQKRQTFADKIMSTIVITL